MRKLAAFSFSFSGAVFLCHDLLGQNLWLRAAGVLAILFFGALLLLRNKPRLLACLICAGLSFGFLWTEVYDRVFFEPVRKLDDTTVRLSAVVTDYPKEREYGSWQVSARMKTEQGTSLDLILYIDDQGASLRPGDRIESVTHCTLGSRSAAGEEITYYTAKGIFLWGRCYGTLTVERPEQIPVRFLPAHLAYLLKGSIQAVFPEGGAGLVQAVVTGSRDKLTDEFTSSLERSGLSHTVAVSGMHLSCFAGILALLLGRGRRITAFAVIGWSLLFCAVAGATPSVTRAAVMIILLQIAPLLGRERDDATTLAFALMLLLIRNPYSAAHVGLQLSFAAVAGIFLFSERLQKWTANRFGLNVRKPSPLRRVANNLIYAVISVFSATLCAMIATVPLTALRFGTLSLIAPLSNLLMLWAVTVIFAGGISVGTLGLFLPDAARILAVPISWAAEYVRASSGVLSGLPFAALNMDSVYYRLWLLFFYAGFLLLLVWKGKTPVVLSLACAAVTLAVCMGLTAAEFAVGSMTAVVLDVGQGQSILLRGGKQLALVDCGGDAPDSAGDTAASYLQSRGRRTLDFLILTHYHDDHANGVMQLLERTDVECILAPDVEPDNLLRQEIFAKAKESGIEVILIERETVISFGDGCLTVFPPLNGQKDANEQGLTVLADAPGGRVLITGDMDGESEKLLMAETRLPKIELLVAGHHGSKYSTTEPLLAVTAPRWCAVSVGADNRYGHPADETLARLNEMGAEVYRTDRDGTILFRFFETEENGGRNGDASEE